MKKYFTFIFLLFCMSYNGYAQAELHFTGLLPDDGKYDLLPKKADLNKSDYENLPTSYSLMQYCPTVESQGPYGTCVGWATGYAARTIAEAVRFKWNDKKEIDAEAFSPLFVYAQAKTDRNDEECDVGAQIYKAMEIMKNTGAVKRSNFDVKCANYVDQNLLDIAASYKIDDFFRLFNSRLASGKEKVAKVKKAISENNPVVIGMIIPRSFKTAGRVWEGDDYDIFHRGHHAMCVVGYDDNESGGAFQIMNSWGTDWGDNGFTWVKYSDFKKFVYQAYEMYVKNILNPRKGTNKFPRLTIDKQKQQDKKTLPIKPKKNSINFLSGDVALLLSSGKNANSLFDREKGFYKLEENLKQNQGFRLYVSNDSPSYVYVIGWSVLGKAVTLFPTGDVSAALTYSTNHIAIPNEDDFLNTGSSDEIRYICVLYSMDSLDINQIIDSINNGTGNFDTRIKEAMGNMMIPLSTAGFSSDKISYQTESEKSVVPVMIEVPRGN